MQLKIGPMEISERILDFLTVQTIQQEEIPAMKFV